MEKIWVRMGGYITADAETMAEIKNGNTDALVKAIKDNGFEVDGETYIPLTDDEDVIDSFELGPITLIVK